MWMRSFFLSCCLFPLRSDDLYLKLLVAMPKTLITGNTKHVSESDWIWKWRTCRLRKWNSPHSRQWWTVQYARTSQAAWRLLNTFQSRSTSFKVQRAESLLSTKPIGVWLTEKGIHSTNTGTHAPCIERKAALFQEKKDMFCSVVALHLGLSSWKRASISHMAELMWAVDFPRRGFYCVTWFQCSRGCGMSTQPAAQTG